MNKIKVSVSAQCVWRMGKSPQLVVYLASLDARSLFRQHRAACHRVAALVELAIPPKEEWIVHVRDEIVYLELVSDDAERGLEVMKKVATEIEANGGEV